jgi:hypothetical protein
VPLTTQPKRVILGLSTRLVEQFPLGRRPGLSPFRIQMGEDLLDDVGVVDAVIRIAPPQAGQVSMSVPKTRFRRCAQVIAAQRSAVVGSSRSSVVAP